MGLVEGLDRGLIQLLLLLICFYAGVDHEAEHGESSYSHPHE